MTITFACGHCEKTFTISIQFAGKKGRCKECGALMLIPSKGPRTRLGKDGIREREPLDPPREMPRYPAVRKLVQSEERFQPPTPITRPRSVEEEPAIIDPEVDLYGLEEEPTPYSSPWGWQEDQLQSVDSPDARKKKLRRFARSRRRSGAPYSGRYRSSDSSRLVLGIVGALVSVVILPGLRGTPSNYMTRAEADAFNREHISMIKELTTLVRMVQDEDSAIQWSSRINEKIRAITKYTRENMQRKVKKKDLIELNQMYHEELVAAANTLKEELTRVMGMPYVIQALDIEASIQEQAAVEAECERLKEENRLQSLDSARFDSSEPRSIDCQGRLLVSC